MKTISGQRFSGVQVDVDDTEFINCEFIDCGLMYGGGVYRFNNQCKFTHTSFAFP